MSHVHDAPNFQMFERPHQDVKATQIQNFGPESLVGLSGNHHDRWRDPKRSCFTKDIFPISIGKISFAKYEVRATLMENAGGFPKRRCPLDSPARLFEDRFQRLAVFPIRADRQEGDFGIGGRYSGKFFQGRSRAEIPGQLA